MSVFSSIFTDNILNLIDGKAFLSKLWCASADSFLMCWQNRPLKKFRWKMLIEITYSLAFLLQVMVWKTNFDAADYSDVLKTQKSSTTVEETHHALVGQHTEWCRVPFQYTFYSLKLCGSFRHCTIEPSFLGVCLSCRKFLIHLCIPMGFWNMLLPWLVFSLSCSTWALS